MTGLLLLLEDWRWAITAFGIGDGIVLLLVAVADGLGVEGAEVDDVDGCCC